MHVLIGVFLAGLALLAAAYPVEADGAAGRTAEMDAATWARMENGVSSADENQCQFIFSLMEI